MTLRGVGIYGGMAPPGVADPGGLTRACEQAWAQRQTEDAAAYEQARAGEVADDEEQEASTMTDPDQTDDFTADRHADLDAGEYGMMADADYYDRIMTGPAVCPDCGHDHETLECLACPEGYCEDTAGTLQAESDFAADLPEREA